MPVYEVGHWTIWTERKNESPRKGFGQETFGRTLDHLRKRGDKTIRFASNPEAPILTRTLRNDRPSGRRR